MSNDRDARRPESLVELFDRFFFCRSFHSKLFPFGGFAKARTPKAKDIQGKDIQGKDTGLHPSTRPTGSQDKSLKDTPDVTTFSSLPSRLPMA